jgi:hypothetical protein
LAKDANDGERKWGFLCAELDESRKWRFLKLFLDAPPERLKDTLWAPNSGSDIDKLVEEYLRLLYLYISPVIFKELSVSRHEPKQHWGDYAVEFSFSVPGTWNQPFVDRFFQIARRAGFGQEPRHRALVGLTEAAAAVVAAGTMSIKFTPGNTILSIDAGGGTTDLAFVTMQSTEPMLMRLVLPVTAIAVGSVMIDLDFKDLVKDRLQTLIGPSDTLEKCASQASQSAGFMKQKHKLGYTYSLNQDFLVQVDDELGPSSLTEYQVWEKSLTFKK